MMTALSPWLWLVEIVIAGAFAVFRPSLIIFLILLFSLLFRKKTEEEQRFYEVTPFQRGVAAFVYFGLILALRAGMIAAFVERPAS